MSTKELPEVSKWLATAIKMEADLLAAKPENRRTASPGGGVGGARHQYIQLIVSQIALNLGYGACVEQQIPKTQKRVDVGIRGRTFTVACEIPITTKHNELGNIRKCLNAGYDYVASVALDRETLRIVEKDVLPVLSPEEKVRVRFFFPEELSNFLEQLGDGAEKSEEVFEGDEQFVRGYKVTTRFSCLPEKEVKTKREAIAKILARALVRNSREKNAGAKK